MTKTDEKGETAGAVVTRRLTNEKGQTYFVKVAVDNPGGFVRELWESMNDRLHGCPQTDDEACREWTDRIRDFRTTVSGNEVCVRTHAWHPSADNMELHADVLSFLRAHGLAV